ncbi:uncharacterized protein TM35_000052490 [Trypanosoma theileri]|uniref:Uncharacterized protein n=1 Tax=Trypanosoma theileri TaxID=67003 RepID=A0A1X0P4S4_9TRYP|nr:uncharacterized protein TM35_000052490 [Trypanosoma theileri]ORC91653.1 hypothetical protein TM35_000052490 [Trypanosoma theileri]
MPLNQIMKRYWWCRMFLLPLYGCLYERDHPVFLRVNGILPNVLHLHSGIILNCLYYLKISVKLSSHLSLWCRNPFTANSVRPLQNIFPYGGIGCASIYLLTWEKILFF